MHGNNTQWRKGQRKQWHADHTEYFSQFGQNKEWVGSKNNMVSLLCLLDNAKVLN